MSTSLPVAVVTGAGGGMGREIVTELARTHHVHAVDCDGEKVNAIAAETGAKAHDFDLTDNVALGNFAATLNRVDVLVNAAAVALPMSVEDATAEDWQRMLSINVMAPSLLTRALLPALREAEATVIFLGSGASTKPIAGSVVYVASKHALRGVADVLRIDEEKHRIRVTTIAPGQTDTPLLRAHFPDAADTPHRYLRPASVADAVRYVVDLPADAHVADIALRTRQEILRL